MTSSPFAKPIGIRGVSRAPNAPASMENAVCMCVSPKSGRVGKLRPAQGDTAAWPERHFRRLPDPVCQSPSAHCPALRRGRPPGKLLPEQRPKQAWEFDMPSSCPPGSHCDQSQKLRYSLIVTANQPIVSLSLLLTGRSCCKADPVSRGDRLPSSARSKRCASSLLLWDRPPICQIAGSSRPPATTLSRVRDGPATTQVAVHDGVNRHARSPTSGEERWRFPGLCERISRSKKSALKAL